MYTAGVMLRFIDKIRNTQFDKQVYKKIKIPSFVFPSTFRPVAASTSTWFDVTAKPPVASSGAS
jgi:hypothetical protein